MATTGRCAVLHEYGQPLELREYPVPTPGPGEILLRVAQGSICGSDLHMWRCDSQSIAIPPGGRALGHEGSGVVAQLGPGIDTDSLGLPLRVGDRVVHSIIAGCGRCVQCLGGRINLCSNKPPARSCESAPHFFGTFADYFFVPANVAVFRVPDELSDDVVAPVNCAMATVMQGLLDAGVTSGTSVVCIGAGGLGLAGVALAKHLGAGNVVVLDRLAPRLKLAQQFGADSLIDVSKLSDTSDRIAAVHDATHGGADVVLELVGVPELLPEGVSMLARGGTFVEIGVFFSGRTVALDPATLVTTGRRIVGSNGYEPSVVPRILEYLVTARDQLPFDRLVSHRFALDNINQAFLDSDWSSRETPVVRAVVQP